MKQEDEKPDDLQNPIGSLFGYRLRRISADDMAYLGRNLTALDISTVAASVLMMIHANNGATQSEVGHCLGIKRANMAPLTTHLEEKGWIKKTPLNGRSYGLEVTEAGNSLCTQILLEMKKTDAIILRNLTDEEKRIFDQLLDKIIH